jgi:two-component system response regulator VicR
MKILIAEDDELMLKILEFRLKKDGHEVFITHDGREAMAKLDEIQPDLLLTDIMMPFSSGLELVAKAKEKFKDKIRIIVLSGLGQENVILEAFEIGADDYITKPFSPIELSLRVKRFTIK